MQTLAREGAKVVISDIDDHRGNTLAETITAAGQEAIYLSHDVTDELHWQAVVAEIERRHGQLDILVANAGIGIMAPSIVEMSLADWRRQTAVNLGGVFPQTSLLSRLLRQDISIWQAGPQQGRTLKRRRQEREATVPALSTRSDQP